MTTPVKILGHRPDVLTESLTKLLNCMIEF